MPCLPHSLQALQRNVRGGPTAEIHGDCTESKICRLPASQISVFEPDVKNNPKVKILHLCRLLLQVVLLIRPLKYCPTEWYF